MRQRSKFRRQAHLREGLYNVRVPGAGANASGTELVCLAQLEPNPISSGA